MQENHLSPAERADVLRNINMKMMMLFGKQITEEMYNEFHEMSDSGLFGVSLSYSMMLMQKRREC